MIWIQFLATALVIVFAAVRLARYGDVLGEKSGLGRSWIGVVLLAATTSLPELFTGSGATALANLPDIAVGDVLGSCMFNLLILSFMDAVQPEPLSTRAHQGHALSIAADGRICERMALVLPTTSDRVSRGPDNRAGKQHVRLAYDSEVQNPVLLISGGWSGRPQMEGDTEDRGQLKQRSS